jgi:carboxyl-terminal processing protease
MLDMSNPGELLITSVLLESPAEKSGARGGDRILKVDDYEITKASSVENVVSRIKGPAGTSVTLTIMRNGTKMDIKIIRQKIKMEMVGYKKLDSNTSLITIASF